MISESELKLLREEQLKYLPQRGIIRRRNFLGAEESFALSVIATDVPCRLTPGFGLWRQVADKYQGITAYTGTFPHGTDIAAGDELIDEASNTYQVRDTMSPKSYETAVRALFDKVTD